MTTSWAVAALAVAATAAILTPRARAAEAAVAPPSVKRFVAAELPAGTPLKNVDVIVMVTIGDDGRVTAATLSRGGGAPYDTAALTAVRRMRFNPATQDGKPIAVRVPFTYRFRIPRRRGRMVPTRMVRRPNQRAPGRVVVGRVVEMGTRTPLAGIPVIARDPRTQREWQAVTDADGRYAMEGLPPGELELRVLAPDYDPGKRTVVGVPVKPGAPPPAPDDDSTVYLNPNAFGKYKTVIVENRRRAAATEITLSGDELTKVPGTFGDPTRVVATLPGVARSFYGLGFYVIRGAAQENSGFFIDGHPAAYLYHFGGGPSVLHPALVERLRFYPAGYPAQYGRLAGGAIAIETKEPASDRLHLDVEVDGSRAVLLLSVPFDGDRGLVTLSVRQSLLEFFLEFIDDPITMRYTDYQVRLRYDVTSALRWSLFVLGAEDLFGVHPRGGTRFDTTQGFHRVGTRIDLRASKDVSWATSVAFQWEHNETAQVAPGADGNGLELEKWFVHLHSTVDVRASPALRLQTGLDALYRNSVSALRFALTGTVGDVPQPLGDPFATDYRLRNALLSVAPFIGADWEPVVGLRLLPSLRANLEEWGGDLAFSVDPKLAVRATVHPMVTLKAMAAIAHQPPDPTLTAPPLGSPDTPPVTAYQASAGLEVRPAEGWEVSVEGFFNHFENLLQTGASDEATDTRLWRADLTGRAYGLEVLVRKAFGEVGYGWLSYTLSRAERRPDPTASWQLFSRDQTHILNLAWTFVFPGEWSLGFRFQLSSGNPYRPVVGAHYDADADRYMPRYADHQDRLPLFHRLDLRIDKRIRFNEWIFDIYFDVQNVYNASNPEVILYSFDYRTVVDGPGTPFFPTVGFRIAY